MPRRGTKKQKTKNRIADKGSHGFLHVARRQEVSAGGLSRPYAFYVKLWMLGTLTVQYSLRAYTSPDVKKCRRAA